MTLCSLCNTEVPVGWPAIQLPRGAAHRFSSGAAGCSPLPNTLASACEELEMRGLVRGFAFHAGDAIDKVVEVIGVRI